MASGQRLVDGFWTGDYSLRLSDPLFQYPRQSKPSPKVWRMWISAIRTVFCHPRTTSLRNHLASWTHHPHRRHISVSLNPTLLWVSPTTCHQLSDQRRTRLVFSAVPISSSLTVSTIPVDILATSSDFIHTSLPADRLPPPTIPEFGSIEDNLANLLPWQKPLLEHVEHLCPLVDVLHHLSCPPGSTSSLLAATDGGASRSVASFGWTIRIDDVDIVSCSGTVPGPSPTSYRAECHGVLSFLLYLSILLRSSPAPVPYCQLTVYIDCQSLLKRLCLHQDRQYFTPSEAIGPERDVLQQIEYYLDLLTICFSFEFVKGHQDDDKELHQLDSAALANIQADSLATSALHSADPSSSIIFFPASMCLLSVSQTPITRNIGNQLRHLIFDQPMRDYIVSSRDWSFTCDIDWDIYAFVCNCNFRRPNFFVKWTHRILPVGHVLHRRDPRQSPYCPACGVYEDHDHLIQCDHPSRHALKQKLMKDLRSGLDRTRYDPVLCDIFIEGVLSVLHSSVFPFHKFPHRYQSLCQSQSNLGWTNLLKGFCSVHWRNLQNQYFVDNFFLRLIDKPGLLSALPRVLDSIESIWHFRNNQRHGVDTQFHESERSRQTIESIVELYDLRDRILPCDHHLFLDSVDTHLSKPQSSLRAWLTNHSDHLFRSHQQAEKDNVTHTHSLTHYFT